MSPFDSHAHAITEQGVRLTGLGMPSLPICPEDQTSRVFLTRTARQSLHESGEKRLRLVDLWKLRRWRKAFKRRSLIVALAHPQNFVFSRRNSFVHGPAYERP
jgi:hypothetical protein